MAGDPNMTAINELHTFGDEKYHVTSVSMGNPHAIIFVDDVKEVPLERIYPVIEHAELFPDRVNVGIVQIIGSGEIEYRVWKEVQESQWLVAQVLVLL